MDFGLNILLVVLLFFSSGGNAGRDLLDLLPTDAYWHAKHITVTADQLESDAGPTASPAHLDALVKDLESPEFKIRDAAKNKIYAMGPAALPMLKTQEHAADPEVKTAATDLVTRLEAHAKERDVRRLMAIRTLGERREQAALPLLQGLEQSKELFVADYAARAVAQIQGKPFVPPDHRAAVAGDLRLLPAGAATVVVGQCALGGVETVGAVGGGQPITLEGMVDESLAALRNNPVMNGQKVPAKDALMRRAVTAMLAVADHIGNVRFDGVTVEVSADKPPNGAAAVVVLRGAYDRDAVIAAIQTTRSPDAGDPLTVTDDGPVKVLADSDNVALMPSNEQLIFIAGDAAPGRAKAQAKVLAALKNGPADKNGGGEWMRNKEITALIKTVDTHAPLWAVARLNADMRQEKMFQGFATITLETRPEKDGISFTFAGHGADAELLKGSTEEIKNGIAAVVAQGQMAVAQMKQLQPMLDFLLALKVEANGTSAAITGTVKNTMVHAIVASVGPMLVGEMANDDATTQP